MLPLHYQAIAPLAGSDTVFNMSEFMLLSSILALYEIFPIRQAVERQNLLFFSVCFALSHHNQRRTLYQPTGSFYNCIHKIISEKKAASHENRNS